jgi:hypothetical protein
MTYTGDNEDEKRFLRALGAEVRAIRQATGYTCEYVARALNPDTASRDRISKLERGVSGIGLMVILCAMFVGCLTSHVAYAEPTPRDIYRAAYQRIEAAIEDLNRISPRGVRIYELEQRWEEDNNINGSELEPSPNKIELVDSQAAKMEAWIKDTSLNYARPLL